MDETKKMNVLFISPYPPPYGGIANWTKMVLEYLSNDSGIKARIVNTAPLKRSTEGRNLINRIVGGGFGMLNVISQVKRIIENENIHCVHITTSGSLSVIRDFLISSVLVKRKIPFVYHIHFGRIPLIRENSNKEWEIVKQVINRAETVIAIDQPSFAVLFAQFGNKIKYIPNPIDIKGLPVPDYSLHQTCTFLGWVIKEKGVEELIAAWDEVVKLNKNWKLKIVGPYKVEFLKKLREKYSVCQVEFIGEKSHQQAMNILNGSDIFILPSYSEGCPYVIMEALILGKKVIGTNVGNIPEMIAKRQGQVVNHHEVEELKEAIVKMINLNDFDGEKIRISAIKEYEIDRIMSEYKKIWFRS